MVGGRNRCYRPGIKAYKVTGACLAAALDTQEIDIFSSSSANKDSSLAYTAAGTCILRPGIGPEECYSGYIGEFFQVDIDICQMTVLMVRDISYGPVATH